MCDVTLSFSNSSLMLDGISKEQEIVQIMFAQFLHSPAGKMQ